MRRASANQRELVMNFLADRFNGRRWIKTPITWSDGMGNLLLKGKFRDNGFRSRTDPLQLPRENAVGSVESASRFNRKRLKNPLLDPKLKPAKLKPAQLAQLKAFLEALSAPSSFDSLGSN